jgi:hypothetical protein
LTQKSDPIIWIRIFNITGLRKNVYYLGFP